MYTTLFSCSIAIQTRIILLINHSSEFTTFGLPWHLEHTQKPLPEHVEQDSSPDPEQEQHFLQTCVKGTGIERTQSWK